MVDYLSDRGPEGVRRWLTERAKLERYYEKLVSGGFDTLARCAAIGEADLDALEISLPGHRKRLLLVAKELSSQLASVGASNSEARHHVTETSGSSRSLSPEGPSQPRPPQRGKSLRRKGSSSDDSRPTSPDGGTRDAPDGNLSGASEGSKPRSIPTRSQTQSPVKTGNAAGAPAVPPVPGRSTSVRIKQDGRGSQRLKPSSPPAAETPLLGDHADGPHAPVPGSVNSRGVARPPLPSHQRSLSPDQRSPPDQQRVVQHPEAATVGPGLNGGGSSTVSPRPAPLLPERQALSKSLVAERTEPTGSVGGGDRSASAGQLPPRRGQAPAPPGQSGTTSRAPGELPARRTPPVHSTSNQTRTLAEPSTVAESQRDSPGPQAPQLPPRRGHDVTEDAVAAERRTQSHSQSSIRREQQTPGDSDSRDRLMTKTSANKVRDWVLIARELEDLKKKKSQAKIGHWDICCTCEFHDRDWSTGNFKIRKKVYKKRKFWSCMTINLGRQMG